MKRKDYQKPTMQVVLLQHRAQILETSGEKQLEKPNNYNASDDPLSF